MKNVLIARVPAVAAVVLLFGLVPGCLSAPEPQQRASDEALFSEAQKALDARDYTDAIEKLTQFLDQFPKSPKHTWALQRLGESFEGLLEVAWSRRIQRGEQQERVTREFLQQYGSYNVWEHRNGRVTYNKTHYRMIVEQFPDSPIADEARYRLIQLSDNAAADPAATAAEITQLEAVLEQYPTTSLRPEILYQIARRCRVLYEVHAFAPALHLRDPQKAEQYHAKAVYAYKLCLQSPEQSAFSQKAWDELTALEAGKRCAIMDVR